MWLTAQPKGSDINLLAGCMHNARILIKRLEVAILMFYTVMTIYHLDMSSLKQFSKINDSRSQKSISDFDQSKLPGRELMGRFFG